MLALQLFRKGGKHNIGLIIAQAYDDVTKHQIRPFATVQPLARDLGLKVDLSWCVFLNCSLGVVRGRYWVRAHAGVRAVTDRSFGGQTANAMTHLAFGASCKRSQGRLVRTSSYLGCVAVRSSFFRSSGLIAQA